MIFCVYKPCDASSISFSNLIEFIEKCINECESENALGLSILLLGDLNFPDLWRANSDVVLANSADEKKLLEFIDNHFLSQYVKIPTRKDNILDLVMTNNDRLVYDLTSDNTVLSDHNIVDILVSTPETAYEKSSSLITTGSLKQTGFPSLNLFKADFASICRDLKLIDWDACWKKSNLEEFPQLLHDIVLNSCNKFTPAKLRSKNKKSAYDRSYRTLMRKLKKLRTRLNCIKSCSPSSNKIENLKQEIKRIKKQMQLLTQNQLDCAEKKAVSKIKTNPKYFYSYVKKFSRVKKNITQLYNKDGNLETDNTCLANILQDQFVSAFSNPNNPAKKNPTSSPVLIDSFLSNITFTIEDILAAIDEINIHASCPNYSIPAIVLIKCKHELALPLLTLWKESLNVGITPSFYKKQVINPTHKKGSRAIPSNYRPISLTAHEIKIFERILRKKLVEHLEKNNLLSSTQHGFRKGRSCLTQLLKHYDNILSNLMLDNETDSLFLDFAKAFDKVDHQILLKKLSNMGIRGKLLKWISSFLSNREQVVVVNGAVSYTDTVHSGVPQGTVLGPILFLIFINDINTSVHHSVLGCFADDTRVSKSISVKDDSLLLQQDLNNLIQWAEVNNMEMHPNKFIFINYSCRSTKLSLANLPFYEDQLQYFLASDERILEPSDTVKDLGITFMSNLSWSTHVSNIVKAARKKAGWVLSSFKNRSPTVMLTLYKYFIRGHLEYRYSCPP